jgi:isopenicillin N synthase-like dioxygenase
VTVPVIDISGDPRKVAAEVGAACGELGFLTVVGHGVPDEVAERAASASNVFFDRPEAEKRALADGDPVLGLPAYRPLRSESLAASLGQKAPGDLKESLDWGPLVPGFGWPERPPDLREAFDAYYATVSDLGARLRGLFARALGLPEDWFDDAFRGHSSSMRAVNYPPLEGEVEPGQLRAGAHTDYGTVTILRPGDSIGGLQIADPSGAWHDVPLIPNSFVINQGDLMARWTNDRWISTLHRVVNPPPEALGGNRRLSIVFFHHPNYDTVIECLPTCQGPSETAKYAPVTVAEYYALKRQQQKGAAA